jgi:hypothetical protein
LFETPANEPGLHLARVDLESYSSHSRLRQEFQFFTRVTLDHIHWIRRTLRLRLSRWNIVIRFRVFLVFFRVVTRKGFGSHTVK